MPAINTRVTFCAIARYKGERGVVAKDLDDKRELGVKLKGYTGTGTFHVTECKREVSRCSTYRCGVHVVGRLKSPAGRSLLYMCPGRGFAR